MPRLARLLTLLLVLVLAPAAAQAIPVGPTLLGGAVITLEHDAQSDGQVIHFGRFLGPTARFGFEVGDFWTSEFSVQFTRSEGVVSSSLASTRASLLTLAGGYQLTLDLLKKKSPVSPYLGVGVLAGDAMMVMDTTALGMSSAQQANVFYLEFHAVVGLRVNLPFGLGLRAEVAASTYGGFYGLMPSVGAAYSW